MKRTGKMAFRLRTEATTFFRHIASHYELDFDKYYFCLMAGLAAKRKADVPTAQTTELVDHFPGEYRSKGRVIVALFLSRELESMGISTSNRRALDSAIAQLVDPLSPSHLSDLGMRALNHYSYGGYEVITDWFDEEPRVFEVFLPRYKQKLEETLQSVLIV
jgi:hypothetical protein